MGLSGEKGQKLKDPHADTLALFLFHVPQGCHHCPALMTHAWRQESQTAPKQQVHLARGDSHGSSFWNQGPLDAEYKAYATGATKSGLNTRNLEHFHRG